MQTSRLLLLLFAILLASCGDSGSPSDNDGGPNGGIDSSGFALLATTTDTLYCGEEAWVRVNELGTDVSILRLFVHTSEAKLLRIEGDRLFFEIARNTSTGKLRLYKHDSLLAKNNLTLHVLPRHIDEFNTMVHLFYPREGFAGDFFNITVTGMPLRRTDFDVFFEGVKLEVDEWDTSRIHVRIPEGQGEGLVTMRVFDRIQNVGIFTILDEGSGGDVFLEEEAISHIVVTASELEGAIDFLFPGSDTIHSPGVGFSVLSLLSLPSPVIRDDSIRIVATERIGEGERTIEVALVPTPGKNAVSGRIVLKDVNVDYSGEIMNLLTVVHVKDINWRIVDGYVTLYANGDKVTEKVVSLGYDFERIDGLHKENLVEYRGGNNRSEFTVTFYP